MAQTAERGLLDMLFSADTNTAWTTEDSALNRQHYSAWLEPVTLLNALTSHTEHIGLVCTSSTSFDQPYTVARMFATLDLISCTTGFHAAKQHLLLPKPLPIFVSCSVRAECNPHVGSATCIFRCDGFTGELLGFYDMGSCYFPSENTRQLPNHFVSIRGNDISPNMDIDIISQLPTSCSL